MTQNTSWKNVVKALENLNNSNLIEIEKILTIEINKLAQLIKSSGYYNEKSKKLKNLCGFLEMNPINELQKLEIEEVRDKLLSVKGIGNETADSIILYAFNKPIFVIDAYTKRLFSRIGICDKNVSYESLQRIFHNNLEGDFRLFNEYHALIVEHVKNVCKKKAICERCILTSLCNTVF